MARILLIACLSAAALLAGAAHAADLCPVTVPEPRMLQISVWDKGLVIAVEKAIRASNLGLNPQTEGQVILNGSYDIAFTMDLALKDLGFAMNFGKEFGVPLDLASMTQQTFMKGKAAYGGAAQSTQIAKLLEDVLNTDLRAPGFPARLE